MKILQITYTLNSGGAERLVIDLANKLMKNNEVHLLSILDDNNENSFYKTQLGKKVTYHCAKEKSGFSLNKLFRINRIIQKISPDIVHLHGTNIILYLIPSILFFKKPKYVETLHSKAEMVYTNKVFLFFIKFIYKKNLVHLVTIGNDNKLSFENFCNIYNSTLIINGRSLPQPTPSYFEIKKEINELKNSDNDLVFIHIGRFAVPKNQEMLVNVFNRINADGIGFVLLIIGNGFNSVNGKKLKLKANPNIHFLGTKTNIADYLYCADAFCLSSLYEGMPMSLIEALACECIPICTPTSGVIDVLKNNENGYVSAGFDEDSYYKSINMFIKNYAFFNKSQLLETYMHYFSIEKCASLYNDLYIKCKKKLN